MPFDVDGAEDPDAENNDLLKTYIQTWIKNAAVSIKHSQDGNIQLPEENTSMQNVDDSRTETEQFSEEAESVPVEESEQE